MDKLKLKLAYLKKQEITSEESLPLDFDGLNPLGDEIQEPDDEIKHEIDPKEDNVEHDYE